MTSRWLTCFSLTVCLAQAATVTGKVTLRNSRDAGVRKNQDFSGVIVSLQPVGSEPTSPPPQRARMLQKSKMFTPHVLAIQSGTTVDFPNDDPIFHNAFSSYNGQVFDVGLYPPGTSRAIRFTRPGAVRVFCNIHASMSAVIVVLQTPYFATSKRDGTFSIEAPARTYELHVFHERASEDTLQKLSRPLTLRESGAVLQPISISEAGHLSMPHKNKYGKEYPPPSSDDLFYPGARP